MNAADMKQVLHLVSEALHGKVVWQEAALDSRNRHEARGYTGRTTAGPGSGMQGLIQVVLGDIWTFTVVRWTLDDGGFGYDGLAANMARGLVVHMTREQAEKAFALAQTASPL